MGMTLADLALRYSLRIRKDSCGDELVPGRKVKDVPDRLENRCHLYQDGSRLMAYLRFATKTRWTNARKKLSALGLTVHRDGEADGIMVFDPNVDTQVKGLVRLCGVRVRRILDPVKAAEAIARLGRHRKVKGEA